MTAKKTVLSLISGVALGALPLAARGDETAATVSPEAQAMAAEDATATAHHYRELADQYRAMGGAGYKTGLVQRAEAEAAKYTATADELTTPPVAPPPPSAEAQHYTDLADQYRAIGGAGYKTGLVQRAEADAQKAEAEAQKPEASPAEAAPKPPCNETKPAVEPSADCSP